MSSNNITNGATNGIANVTTKPVSPSSLVSKLGMAAYRAPSLLQPHQARLALRDAHEGKIPPLIGFFCGLSSPPVAKVVAQMGWDIVWIDWEHADTNVETMTQMVHDVQFVSEGRTMAFVRVPGHDHAAIGYALDAGASIVVPQVDTVEQARHIVSAAKYGAKINGTRSAPPARYLPGISDKPLDPKLSFHENVNKQAAIIIQIESIKGIDNLDAILSAVGEHIDSVWLGSLDARISMGLVGLWGDEPEWIDAVRKYESALAKYDIPASGLTMGTPEQKIALARGRSLLFGSADFMALLGTGQELAWMRETFGAESRVGVYQVVDEEKGAK